MYGNKFDTLCGKKGRTRESNNQHIHTHICIYIRTNFMWHFLLSAGLLVYLVLLLLGVCELHVLLFVGFP